MSKLKIILKKLLFPHFTVIAFITPAATALLIYSLIYKKSDSLISVFSYVFSAYTLTVICCEMPAFIKKLKSLKTRNRFLAGLSGNIDSQIKVALFTALIMNGAYFLFQLGLGIYHNSLWYYSLAGYYLSLGFMRLMLLKYNYKRRAKTVGDERALYRACGFMFLIINISLFVILGYMIYQNKGFEHHEITAIAMAAYTFYAFTASIVNLVRFKKYRNMFFITSKIVSLSAASVSMITLSAVMLTVFGDGNTALLRSIVLTSLGGLVCTFNTVMAVYMLMNTKKITATEGSTEELSGKG